MSRFAQYYIKYHHEFAPYDWEKRQEHLGALFDTDESITFKGVDDDSKEKHYKHKVYHLHNNPKIIVMRFANDIDIPVEIDFEHKTAKNEPSCFVIIDNRDNLRTVAIQRRRQAFGSAKQVAQIIGSQLSDKLYNEYCYSMEISPEYYPEDLFAAWEHQQMHAQALNFGFPEGEPIEIMQKVAELKDKGKEYFDDSMIPVILQMAVEAKKANYKQKFTVMPEDRKTALYVDKTSTYMKNLLTLSRAMGMPVELVTRDSGIFRCFVEADEDDSDKIASREFDENLLEQLFSASDNGLAERAAEASDINRIEGEIVEMLNGMKHESEDEEEQPYDISVG